MIRSKKIFWVCVLSCIFAACLLFAGMRISFAETNTDYMERMQDLEFTEVIDGEEVTIKYRLYIPESYDPSESYPMITMLHGHGGQGDDNTTSLNVFKPLLTRLTTLERLETDPAILLVPQCRANHKWVNVNTWTGHYSTEMFDISKDLQAVVDLTDAIMDEYSVDETRQYVTGHSMGGLAVWDLLARFPGRYAAAIPISGAGNDPQMAKNMKDVNIWAFHGALDATVDISVTENMVDALRAQDGNILYTSYADKDHSIGTYVYQNEADILDFLFCSRQGEANKYFAEKPTVPAVPDDLLSRQSFSFVNNVSKTDYNGMHYSKTDALSWTIPSDTTLRANGIRFNFAQPVSASQEQALRINVHTVVPAMGREGLWIGIGTQSGVTAYLDNADTNTAIYRASAGGSKLAETRKNTSNDKGLSVYVIDSTDIAGNKMFDGQIIIPLSQLSAASASDLEELSFVEIWTDMMYSKNIWNFGDIELGTTDGNGSFTYVSTLWSPFGENNTAAGYEALGTDAAQLDLYMARGGEFYTSASNAEAAYFGSSFTGTGDAVSLAGYDGILLTVDNSASSAVCGIEIYLYDSSLSAANSVAPAYGWQSKNGLALFMPDADCAAYKNSFCTRSSYIPAGFKGQVFISFTLNSEAEWGCFQPRNNAPAQFPQSIYDNYQIYLNNPSHGGIVIGGVELVADAQPFMASAFAYTSALSLSAEDGKTIMVQGTENVETLFELWTNNETSMQFSECNETNEDIKGGAAFAFRIQNLNDAPFILSVSTWNTRSDLVRLGGKIPAAQVKLVTSDGDVIPLDMRYGYLEIPARADGTVVISYTGGLDITKANGMTTTYELGYPVKGIYRLLFNAFAESGEVAYTLGDIAVVKGDGTHETVKIGDNTLVQAALESDNYKKDRSNIVYSGEPKTFALTAASHDHATVAASSSEVLYGASAAFTVSGLQENDFVLAAYLNGEDVTKLLSQSEGVYTLSVIVKEDMQFSVVLDSDPKYFDVTVTAGEHGSISPVPSEPVLEGQSVTFTVTPDSGYEAVSFKVNGTEKIGDVQDGTIAILIESDTAVEAVFGAKTYTINYVLDGGKNSGGNPAEYTVESDTIVLSPAEKEHYTFAGWYSGEEKIESIEAGSAGDITLTARWELMRYEIVYELNTNQGTIQPAPTDAEYGSEVTFTVSAKEGYKVSAVTVNGTAVQLTEGKMTMTVTGDMAVAVAFEKDESSNGDGSQDPSDEDTQTPPSEKGGCGSSIYVGTFGIATGLFIVGALLLRKKRNQEK